LVSILMRQPSNWKSSWRALMAVIPTAPFCWAA
jgi:hypothetical protein